MPAERNGFELEPFCQGSHKLTLSQISFSKHKLLNLDFWKTIDLANPKTRHKSKDKLPDVTKNCHVNLVLVDELDATGKYPSLALANLKVFNNGNLEPASVSRQVQ